LEDPGLILSPVTAQDWTADYPSRVDPTEPLDWNANLTLIGPNKASKTNHERQILVPRNAPSDLNLEFNQFQNFKVPSLLSESKPLLKLIPSHESNLTWENSRHPKDTFATISKEISHDFELPKSKPPLHSQGLLPVQIAQILEDTIGNSTHIKSITQKNSSNFPNLEILNEDINVAEDRNDITAKEAFDILYQRVKDERMASRETFGRLYTNSVTEFSKKANTDALFDLDQHDFEIVSNSSQSVPILHTIPDSTTLIPSENANCTQKNYCSAQQTSEKENLYCDATPPGEDGWQHFEQSCSTFDNHGLIPNFGYSSLSNLMNHSQFDTNTTLGMLATLLENLKCPFYFMYFLGHFAVRR
jgi:hypothetical protein